MDKLKVELKNCYGICALDSEFDFADGKSTHIIYAPNGVMKTSFSRVFYDYSMGLDSKDLIFTEKVPVRKILDINNNEIDKNIIFVIKPYDETFKSDKISTLLVNEELKLKYDDIHKKINIEKDKLIIELKKTSGLKNSIEEEISMLFFGGKNNFFGALDIIKDEVLNDTDSIYSDISYAKVFDDNVITFLETGEFKKDIKKYIEKYDELLNASTYLKRGFNHYNASTVHKNLNDNGFFKAQHSINLVSNGSKTEISSEKDLLKIIQDEKERIINDSELKKIFDSIDKKISNEKLRSFREYLFEHKEILPELINLKKFGQVLWISYLKNNKVLFENLVNEYKTAQQEIKAIIAQAKSERTDWENVVDIYNRRFYVPYKLVVKNKGDVILQTEVPSIHYHFEGREDSTEEKLLLSVLSQGEKRALYLLNIIFEIESRKKQGLKTLFIIDDIADSFDYKNKYAIIEYLQEITEFEKFFSIILTHNFDFFRTIQDRVGMNKYENSYMATRENNNLRLEKLKYKYISNPFNNWKENLDNPVKLIASVTFARNIAEYTGDNDNFKKLTSILHMKPDTSTLKISDIENTYKEIFKDLTCIPIDDKEKDILGLLYENVELIYENQTEIGLNLENKIVLSMAIRLYAEKYMISRINDATFVNSIKINQTRKLFGRFKKDFSCEVENISILEKVNLMTPENIHLNSFMFEPILDISDFHLKQLYEEIKILITTIQTEQTEQTEEIEELLATTSEE